MRAANYFKSPFRVFVYIVLVVATLLWLVPIITGMITSVRTFDDILFEKAGIHNNWVQENHSRSELKNIIRGLHFQFPPHVETKLVRCIRGAVLDVFVDLLGGGL